MTTTTLSPTLGPTFDPTESPTEDWFVDWTTTVDPETRPPIPTVTVYIYVESCTIDASDELPLLLGIGIYGVIFTAICFLKSCRAFHTYNRRYDEYREKNICRKIAQYFIDLARKRNIYFFILLHIWNQATDLGVVLEMLFLSFTDCSFVVFIISDISPPVSFYFSAKTHGHPVSIILCLYLSIYLITLTALGTLLLYRMFFAGVIFMLWYRLITAVTSIYATQRPWHFFSQIADLLLIDTLSLDYVFERESLSTVQIWLIYMSCALQSFPLILIATGTMALTQGFTEHPYLVISCLFAFTLSTLAIIVNDRIIYVPQAQQFKRRNEHFLLQVSCEGKEVVTGYCCYCERYRIEFVYRVLFRACDFQLRVFLLGYVWVAIGGVYLFAILFFEFVALYMKARAIGRYQLVSGLLGTLINYTSVESIRFCKKFNTYRFISNLAYLAAIWVATNIEMELPFSEPFERRYADIANQSNAMYLYYYMCWLALLTPWLYFGAIKGGNLVRDDDDAATNPNDPFSIIANQDFDTFLELIAFQNRFYHGNEWVFQGLMDGLKDDIFLISAKFLKILLQSYNWEFTHISYYTKSMLFAAVMRLQDVGLSRLLFEKLALCGDVKGIEAGIMYWCDSKSMEGDSGQYLRMIKSMQSKFVINRFSVHIQSALLKYTILWAARKGDLVPFRAMLQYNLHPMTLHFLYLHYTDFTDSKYANTAWDKELFATILYNLHIVKKFRFNVDSVTAKCFLFWALKFELWETVHELLKNPYHSKQIYSKFNENRDSFLHLVCQQPCDYEVEVEKSRELCEIAEYCINRLYSPLNEKNKMRITNLMYAVQMLHVPLVEVLLKYGPDLEAADLNGNDMAWRVEHNYWITNHYVVGMEPLEEEKEEEESVELTVSKTEEEEDSEELYGDGNTKGGEEEEEGDNEEEEEEETGKKKKKKKKDKKKDKKKKKKKKGDDEEQDDSDGDGEKGKETGDPDGEEQSADLDEEEKGDVDSDNNDDDEELANGDTNGHVEKPKKVHIKLEPEVLEQRQKAVLNVLQKALSPTYDEEDFMEHYQERFDKFVQVDDTVALYRSSKNDLSALFEAILKNDFQQIIDLIDKDGVDPNMPSVDGTTPLHFACEHSGALVIKFLMDRGAYPFKIQSGKMYPRDMMVLNDKLEDDERQFMERLLDVRDVRHDPFAMTDDRVVEVERIQLFVRLFAQYSVMLFCIWLACFGSTAMLTNYFGLDYKAPL